MGKKTHQNYKNFKKKYMPVHVGENIKPGYNHLHCVVNISSVNIFLSFYLFIPPYVNGSLTVLFACTLLYLRRDNWMHFTIGHIVLLH